MPRFVRFYDWSELTKHLCLFRVMQIDQYVCSVKIFAVFTVVRIEEAEAYKAASGVCAFVTRTKGRWMT